MTKVPLDAVAGARDEPVDDRVVRAGLRRFDRLFDVIIGVFGLLFLLQTGDSFAADLPGLSNPLGYTVVGLVVLGVLAGLVPALAPARARPAFLLAVGVHAAALLLWPLSVEQPVPADPMPWLVAVWPIPAAYAAQVGASRVVTVAAALAASAWTGVALHVVGGLEPVAAAVDGVFMAGIAVVLLLLLGLVRRGVVRVAEAQQTALAGFAASRIDEATEVERKRTDALLHDAVLTTFLAAAESGSDESDRLSRGMAANALRVLLHVNGVGRDERVVPFGQVLTAEFAPLAPLRLDVDLDIGAAESVMLPQEVASAVTAVLQQVLLHGSRDGTGRPVVRADPLGPDGVRIVISGCGPDPDAPDEPVLESIDRLRALEGRVDLRHDGGRVVTVSWGSVVMVGIAPVLDEGGAALAAEPLARS